MTIIVNPGSGTIPDAGNSWTNTKETAIKHAVQWLDLIEQNCIHDVQLIPEALDLGDGRWRFKFRHTVTGKVIELDTHGVDNLVAYESDRIFPPRVYWNGSSTSEPEIEQWLTDGFEVVKTIRPVANAEPVIPDEAVSAFLHSDNGITETERTRNGLKAAAPVIMAANRP